ncbi:N-acetylglucosamine kinase-like BadF-type ATPase [Paenibacillus rhizosphaerae]|uniref:N-acetylglucosamine kinase-like BadF-type ATPase n=1 Tax=Paenibacillus rhizosphaerae TaxID=297318 RepID=A0A839TUK4_9BACL|nr:BadF/BadG/BcrA/BcrD ATPase family protein [Paenibacillus rhizosphaerae]MBB3128357.1 N-acetylglucosamine kinase-like BadF-type ATPase [Paenibacillus rhizosphaerae]
MGYCLSVDGGGTKIIAVLFDHDWNCLAVGRSGPINPNFTRLESVKANMEACIRECLKDHPQITLGAVYAAMPGPIDLLAEVIGKYAQVGEMHAFSEGYMCLLAGIQRRRGIVALAGTGSGIFGVREESQTHLGGWGSHLGDEGSGYDIGRQGMMAAIQSFEGRGPVTMLEELIIQRWQLKHMDDIISVIYGTSDIREVISSCSLIVSEAAMSGDAVAQGIFAAAGESLASQVCALMNRDAFDDQTWVMAAGSVWKGHSLMFTRFREVIREKHPKAVATMPLFEPVMGGVIHEAMRMGEGDLVDGPMLQRLKAPFEAFLYQPKDI